MFKRYFIIALNILIICMLCLFSPAFSQQNQNIYHFSLSGFGSYMRQFDLSYTNILAKSFHPSYGFRLHYKVNDEFAIQVGINLFKIEKSYSTFEGNEMQNGVMYYDKKSELESKSYNLVAVIFPIKSVTNTKLRPFLKFGLSKNYYTAISNSSGKIKDENGIIVEGDTINLLPKFLKPSNHRDGFILGSGFLYSAKERLEFYFEMQINSIRGDLYNGGFFLNSGIKINLL